MQKAVSTYLENHKDTNRKVCAEHVLCDFLKTQTDISLDFIKEFCSLRAGDAYYSFELISTVIDKLGDKIDFGCLHLLLSGDNFKGDTYSTPSQKKKIYLKSFDSMASKVIEFCLKKKIQIDNIRQLFINLRNYHNINVSERVNKIILDKEKQILESKTNENVTIKDSEFKATKLNEKGNNLDDRNENSNNNINEENKRENEKDNLNIENNINKSQVKKNIKDKNDNLINSQNQLKETKINEKENNFDSKNEDENKDNIQEGKINLGEENKNNNSDINNQQPKILFEMQKEQEIVTTKLNLKQGEFDTKNIVDINNNIDKKSSTVNNLEGKSFLADKKGQVQESTTSDVNRNKSQQEKNPEVHINNNSINKQTIEMRQDENENKNKNQQDINLRMGAKNQNDKIKINDKNINRGTYENDHKLNQISGNVPTPYSKFNNKFNNLPENSNETNNKRQSSNPDNNIKCESQITQENNKFFTWNVNLCTGVILGLCALAFIKLWILAFIVFPGGCIIYKIYEYKQLNNQQKLAKSNLQVGSSGEQQNKGYSVNQNLSKPRQEDIVDKQNNNNNSQPYQQ